MKKSVFITLGIAVVLSLASCSNANKSEKVVEKEAVHEAHAHEGEAMDSNENEAMLCGHCGQIKGSEKCCVEGAEKCDNCKLDKDSPGCCKITQDTKLCSHCGEIAGSDVCCKAEAVVCEKCGLHAGSPGCCKI